MLRGCLVAICLAGCLGTPARPSDNRSDAALVDGSGDSAACTFGAWGPPGPIDVGPALGDEGGPWLSPDQLDLWFSEFVAADNVNHIYHAHRASRATRTFTDVTKTTLSGDVYEPWLSPDQTRMWHQTHASDYDVWFADRSATAASFNDKAEVLLPDPSGRNETSPSLTGDELELFVSVGNGGSADSTLRLHVAKRAMATDAFGQQVMFDPPTKIGDLDSLEPDDDPSISPDGLTLFWTRGGTGSERIMTGTRADRTSSTWTSSEFAPVMTGHETSSPFYSHDGTTLVFSMFDDIKSSWDLYMVERPCN